MVKKRTVAVALGSAGVGSVKTLAPALAEALKDGDEKVRWAAALSLGNLGETATAATPQLIAALSDKNDRVVQASAVALGNIGKDSKQGAADLVKELANKNAEIRERAAVVLSKLGPDAQETVSALLKTSKEDEDPDVRIAVIVALGALGSAPGVVRGLAAALKDPSAEVCHAAASSLTSGPQPRKRSRN